MERKKLTVVIPQKEAIAKLEDLIKVELDTIRNFLDEATKVKQELAKIVDVEYRENILTAYDSKVSEILYQKHIDSLVTYISLLAYAKALDNKDKLYAFEDNFGNMQITYKPYIVQREE